VRGPKLRIVSINDVYTLDNLPRLATLVRHYRDDDPADKMLVILAGDFLGPSLLSSLDAGRGMAECLDAIGVTHVVLGNHEDDVPLVDLRRRIVDLHATWLGANVTGFDPPLRAHDVVEVHGPGGRVVRVGLVGVVMNDPAVYRSAPFGGAGLGSPNEAVLRETAQLTRTDGCACVVAVTHQAIADDRALALDAPRLALPAIIGGHEHAVFVEQDSGTWIVKAGMNAERAAITELTWEGDGPPMVTVGLDPVTSYAEDGALRALVESHMAKVHAIESATLLRLGPGEVLSSVGTRARQTSMGTLVCSRLRDALGAEVGVFNGGGIRASREYRGHLTYGDVKAELPFDNEVVVVRMPGRVLAAGVAASRANAPAESGGFLQVDDRTEVDETSHRLLRVDGEPLDPQRIYRVATVRDLLGGMDHIEPFARWHAEDPSAVPPSGSGREVKLVLVESFAVALWRTLGGFDMVDANHDGQVTEDEIAAAIARVNEEAPSSVAAQLVLQAIDARHAGTISRDDAERVGSKPSPR
jgi:2',3'-cyclic-nucleotide 2'-phosphodiesterase (5'-nucleotidase family)